MWPSGGFVSRRSFHGHVCLRDLRSRRLGGSKFFFPTGLVRNLENLTRCLLSNPRGQGSREPPRGGPGAFILAINRVFQNQQNAVIAERPKHMGQKPFAVSGRKGSGAG